MSSIQIAGLSRKVQLSTADVSLKSLTNLLTQIVTTGSEFIALDTCNHCTQLGCYSLVNSFRILYSQAERRPEIDLRFKPCHLVILAQSPHAHHYQGWVRE